MTAHRPTPAEVLRLRAALSRAEVHHLLALLSENQTEGSYYGNKAHYIARALNLQRKLLASLDAAASPCQPEPEKET